MLRISRSCVARHESVSWEMVLTYFSASILPSALREIYPRSVGALSIICFTVADANILIAQKLAMWSLQRVLPNAFTKRSVRTS